MEIATKFGAGSRAAVVMGLVVTVTSLTLVGGSSVAAVEQPVARFHPVGPERIADTRVGLGGLTQKLRADAPVDLVVPGKGGVPAEHVTAVVVNVIAGGPTADGWMRVSPTGRPAGTSSNVNFRAGSRAYANAVTVEVGDGGAIHFALLAGEVDLIVDVAGWYDDGTVAGGSELHSVDPSRVLDTRDARSGPRSPLHGGQSRTFKVTGLGGVPAEGVVGVVLNLTAVEPTEGTYLQAWPSDQPRPKSSNLNAQPGEIIANLVMAGVAEDGTVSVYNFAGATDVVVDVFAWYGGSGTGAAFHPATPTRLADTRSGQGGSTGPIGQGRAVTIKAAGAAGLPASGVRAVMVNLTAVDPTAAGYLSASPGGAPVPEVSNVNFTAGQITPNLAVVPVGPDGTIQVANGPGQTQAVVDVFGWFA